MAGDPAPRPTFRAARRTASPICSTTTICATPGSSRRRSIRWRARVTLPAIAPEFSASPPAVRRLWPTLGEHTREVLREAGFTDAEIDAIAAAGS